MRKLVIAIALLLCASGAHAQNRVVYTKGGTNLYWSSTTQTLAQIDMTNGITLVAEPTADDHAATRLYVDSGDAAGNLLFWFDVTSSNAIAGNYYDMMQDFPSTDGTNVMAAGITNGEYIISFIATSNLFTKISAGTEVNVHYHAIRVGNPASALSVKPELYVREFDGTQTNEIEDGQSKAWLTVDTDAGHDSHISISRDVEFAAGDRLVIRFKVTSINGSVGAEFYTGPTYASKAAVPTDTLVFVNKTGDTMTGKLTSPALDMTGDIDMTSTGNRIDLDTDNDSSIRASADDVVVIEAGGSNTLYVIKGKVGIGTDAPELGSGTTASGYIEFGDSDDQDIGKIQYDHAADILKFRANNIVAAWFEADGDFNMQGHNVVNESDRLSKTNILVITNASARIAALDMAGVSFSYTNKLDETQLGCLAQEIEKQFPEAVKTSPVTGRKGIAYHMLIGPIMQAIKEQHAELEALKKRVADLEK